MAATQTRRRVSAGRNTQTGAEKKYYRIESYEEGSAVRQIALPLPEEQPQVRPARKVSTQTRRNRARAQSISAGYMVFLSLVCVATMFLCIHFLQLKARLITQGEQIAVMETNLSQIRADNDAYFKHALASVTLDEVRATALDKLGMHTAGQSQIRYYSADDTGSYVRQYQEVPD